MNSNQNITYNTYYVNFVAFNHGSTCTGFISSGIWATKCTFFQFLVAQNKTSDGLIRPPNLDVFSLIFGGPTLIS